jgi:hypothetical protein
MGAAFEGFDPELHTARYLQGVEWTWSSDEVWVCETREVLGPAQGVSMLVASGSCG